ncbi:MAG: SDR family NAD(P)-dependent oxidoreductase [Rhodobacterales bacterium]|nr:SDR family NAD(P)-dependent oxidoreductase [Rhodobacterales bacterium]
MKTVFITGCATGFGHRLAKRLLELGHNVIATDPSVADWPAQVGAPNPNLLVLPLDVRDTAQVKQAVADALAWSPVDVLVNNGGYAIFGSQEETDLSLIEELFAVNVIGVARVTQALLPTLRERGGTVVQLSSVAGRTVFPESGYYAATKYAVEAMSEALFQESCTFGVKVRLVQPGSFDTKFIPTAIAMSPEPSSESPYDHLREAWGKRKTETLEPPQDPMLVVNAIIASLDDSRPFYRVPVGPDSERIIALRDTLGADRWSRLAADRNGLEAPHSSGDFPGPDDILSEAAAGKAPRAEVLEALASGHLDHWRESETGLQALQILAR